MKKIIALFALVLLSFAVKAQTNVSGGLFANTTWTLANSPYIVTGNIVLFPGLTLTVEPGVTVKFDAGTMIEIRQASIIALGTSTDSITFTSNGVAAANTWDKIWMNGGGMIAKFAYCNFRYATDGFFDQRLPNNDSLIIRHCTFRNNGTGYTGTGTGTNCGIVEYTSFTNNGIGCDDVYGTTMNYCDISYNGAGYSCHSINVLNNCTITHNTGTGLGNLRNTTVNYCTVNNNATGLSAPNGATCNYCTIDSNTVGIDIGKTSQVRHCVFNGNGTAIYDHQNGSNPSDIRYNAINSNGIGIHLTITIDSIVCNHICDNTTYDLAYGNVNNINLKNNYWCVPDSASLQAYIYDAHDNLTYGIVNYMPMDDGNCSVTTAIHEQHNSLSFEMYPNPATSTITIELPDAVNDATIRIYNSLGQICTALHANSNSAHIDVSSLDRGIYFVEVDLGKTVARKKFVKE